MSDPTQSLIVKALDGLAARQVATAQNIANAGTPNYRPMRVTFEQALARAALSGPAEVAAVAPQTAWAITAEGPMRLDLELATASTTAARYTALVEVLDRQLRLQHLAITGNT